MAEDKAKDGKQVATGWVVLEFTKPHGSRKKGDIETYHTSTAKALVNKLKVATIKEKLTKYVPKEAAK